MTADMFGSQSIIVRRPCDLIKRSSPLPDEVNHDGYEAADKPV